MSRAKAPAEQPDAVVHSSDRQVWAVFCVRCPRELTNPRNSRAEAMELAREHLELSHGLHRVWVSWETPGYRPAVQEAFALALAHHRTLTTDHRAR